MQFFANLKERKDLNLPPLYLFTLKFRDIDWFGWGDWLYFVISVASVFQSFLQTYIRGDDDLIAPYYLSVNVLFLLDSIAYMIGYMLFVYDLRAALLTGLVSENNTGALTYVFKNEECAFIVVIILQSIIGRHCKCNGFYIW